MMKKTPMKKRPGPIRPVTLSAPDKQPAGKAASPAVSAMVNKALMAPMPSMKKRGKK